MSSIQFERRKRKKGYLIPLAVILLLYFIIPVYLINKGSDLINLSLSKIENQSVYYPPVEFYNGVSFLNTAAAFPGFGKWSENIVEASIEKMYEQQNKQFNRLCMGFLDDEIALPEGVEISIDQLQIPVVLQFKAADSGSTIYSISLNDSLIDVLDSVFCKPWTKFYNKTKLDKAKLHSYCKSNN